MKEFRKTKDGLFICEECNKLYKIKNALSWHINKCHDNEKKEYYDKWIKEENEDKCEICNNITKSHNLNGYNSTCCKQCADKLSLFKTDQKIKYQKYKQTCLQKYGVENAYQSKEIKEKIKQTCLKKYGVEYTHQNINILNKAFKSAKVLKQFRNTNIWYQGSYELDFLEKYYDKYPDIQRGPSIKYNFNNKNKVYHSDFLLPSLNLIIEIKSSWILNVDIEINEKKTATINSGFNYIMILDKNYINFLQLISNQLYLL
jgi:uncharacterized C2H2 Zn-finger protein